MPKAKHYGIDLLDTSYRYTFDEKYKQAVLNSNSGIEVARLFIKPKGRELTLVK